MFFGVRPIGLYTWSKLSIRFIIWWGWQINIMFNGPFIMSHIIEPIYWQRKWNAFVLTIERPMLLNNKNIMLLNISLKSTHITPHLSLHMVPSWNVENKLLPLHILQSSSTLSLLFEISHKGLRISEQPYVHISSFNLAQQCLHVLRTLVYFLD